MPITRRTLLRSSLAAPVILRALPSSAQDTWPARDIHVICGYAPGTGADIVVRLFAEKLRPFAKQTIVVENKPGAGTSIASEFVARASPTATRCSSTRATGSPAIPISTSTCRTTCSRTSPPSPPW